MSVYIWLNLVPDRAVLCVVQWELAPCLPTLPWMRKAWLCCSTTCRIFSSKTPLLHPHSWNWMSGLAEHSLTWLAYHISIFSSEGFHSWKSSPLTVKCCCPNLAVRARSWHWQTLWYHSNEKLSRPLDSRVGLIVQLISVILMKQFLCSLLLCHECFPCSGPKCLAVYLQDTVCVYPRNHLGNVAIIMILLNLQQP